MSDHGSQTGTAERMARVRGRVDVRQRDIRVARMADRIVPVFERMSRDGTITPDECSAGQRFAASWYGARRQPGLVGSYGDQRWSGTSAGQAANDAMTAEEWPLHHATELAKAKAAIGDEQTASALERIVEADATLEDIGRAFLAYRDRKKAQAAGAAVAKMALGRLVRYYGYGGRR